ncbi:MAG: hypothetical protein QF902_01130 [Rhodospirillales bacterium]|nr:hypothetical protein [Rhodospirillales bacterium]
MPLLCEGGECAADITTICLQRDRDMPLKGTVYDIMTEAPDDQPLRIVGLLADGGEVELASAAAPVSIVAERGHLAVKLSVSASVVDRFQLSQLIARVSGPVVLAPRPEPGDDNPQTETDLAESQGTLRSLAEETIAANPAKMAVAAVLHEAVNALPRLRATTRADHQAAWRRASASASGAEAEKAIEQARNAFRACSSVALGSGRKPHEEPTWEKFTFRDCLGTMHNGAVNPVNETYWKNLYHGS